MSLLTPYLFSGSVSLYLSYKLYNSYYKQPFQYLEIEEEINESNNNENLQNNQIKEKNIDDNKNNNNNNNK